MACNPSSVWLKSNRIYHSLPHSSWVIALAEVKRESFERDKPGVEKSWY